MKKYLFLLILILISASCVSAEEIPDDTKYYLGGYFSYNLPQLDDANVKNAFTQPVSVSYENTFGLQIRGGMDLNDFITGEVLIEYVNPFEDTSDNKTAEVNVIDLGVNFKFVFAYLGRVQPYASAGLGIVYATEKITYLDQERSGTDLGLGIRPGVGCDVRITPAMSAGIEFSYLAGIGAPSYVKFMNIAVGLNYRF